METNGDTPYLSALHDSCSTIVPEGMPTTLHNLIESCLGKPLSDSHYTYLVEPRLEPAKVS